ncbi:hypothetical protein HMPREF1318_2729 [Actinomyces massiliensis F0489]|uniref:Uncharacterized protein n=1 Tax=Actinomyces massiliensis F0489 TaxID=1125718 RepID=J1HK57_9ACTO|nr:hypothetical protein HMPREF1318_2729 [Actinomyces massiliensis F0489]
MVTPHTFSPPGDPINPASAPQDHPAHLQPSALPGPHSRTSESH